jgi:nicotinate dehydrogenase subunit B
VIDMKKHESSEKNAGVDIEEPERVEAKDRDITGAVIQEGSETGLGRTQVTSPFSRRAFLQAFGGGIVVLFAFGDPAVLLAQEQRTRREEYPTDFNAYLLIGEDGRVTCLVGKIEMGQGVVTSLAQELAEELDVPIESVDMVMGDTDLCPWDRGTWGSLSTRAFGPVLRAAAAEARAALKELASEELSVPTDRLACEDGAVYDRNNPAKRVAYARLTRGKRIERHVERPPKVKDPSEFKIVHKPLRRRDAAEKVTGKAVYAGDVQLPGMLYASILRPPAHGAVRKSLDTSEAEKIPGVTVVHEGDLVAVLHARPDMAAEALAKIDAHYDMPKPSPDDKTIYEHLLKVAPKGEVIASGGDLQEGRRRSDVTVEKEYLNAYVAHAPMETHTSTATFENGKLTVWASTQSPFGVKAQLEEALGLPPEKVRVITPFVGGGFGGKSANQQSTEAARLSRIAGKPVQVAWTRAEEFFFDTYRPAAVVKILSGAKKSGQLTLWDYSVYCAGSRGAEQFYDIPSHRTTVHGSGWRGERGVHPFATGPWRAPANNTNSFARESQIDIMAAQLGMDPLELRLANLSDKQMRGVLEAAAKQFNWTAKKPSGATGRGVACGMDAGTYVALMAEVDVDRDNGRVHVKRVVCAQDMGLCVNPQGAKIQVEGCITMGLGYALSEGLRFKGGQILDVNFDSYEFTRFSMAPAIETVIIDRPQAAPQGGGEPAIICVGAVVANAVFDAVGARLLELPMRPERIREALKAG